MMRRTFDEQLDQLNTELIEMGSLCEEAIAKTAKALLEGDLELAKSVSLLDDDIDQKEKQIETLCLKLLLQQQPVARDLRLISAVLKMITDIERIGDQAHDIAEIILVADLTQAKDISHIGDMARATIQMVNNSIDAFVRRDLELAREVIMSDDTVDDLFTTIRGELLDYIRRDQNHLHGEYVIDLLMIVKYFERIGDHATNIAEWVEFAITGTHKSGKLI